MSYHRDVDHDREATRAVLAGERDGVVGRTNWLGHRVGSGAARIDELLIAGATKEEIAAARGGGDDHLRHLREVHGLLIVEAGGVWMFDRSGLPVSLVVRRRRARVVKPPQHDAVLLAGSDEELNEYIANSGKCLVVDWRSDEESETEALAALLPDGWLSGKWVGDGADTDLAVTYRGKHYMAGLTGNQTNRYVWLRRMNQIMAGDFELRAFRFTLGDDTHCFLPARCRWWAAMDAAFPKEVQRVFAKITRRSKFP